MNSFADSVSSTLKVGTVYKMEAPELINTNDPHYFIIIAINEDDNYAMVTTTQLENKIQHVNSRGYSIDTIAYICPSYHNGFVKDTYINCNDYHVINTASLLQKESEGVLYHTGRLCYDEYESVVKAINESKVNDIPRFLLEYKED